MDSNATHGSETGRHTPPYQDIDDDSLFNDFKIPDLVRVVISLYFIQNITSVTVKMSVDNGNHWSEVCVCVCVGGGLLLKCL